MPDQTEASFWSDDEAIDALVNSLKEIKKYKKEEERRRWDYGHMAPWQEEDHAKSKVRLRAALRHLVAEDDA